MEQKSDDALLSEYYSQFKDQKDDKKYTLIPKFYSKVNYALPRSICSNVQDKLSGAIPTEF